MVFVNFAISALPIAASAIQQEISAFSAHIQICTSIKLRTIVCLAFIPVSSVLTLLTAHNVLSTATQFGPIVHTFCSIISAYSVIYLIAKIAPFTPIFPPQFNANIVKLDTSNKCLLNLDSSSVSSV
jgi:hypothetical protein